MEIALVAHNERRSDLIEFATAHEETLGAHDLVATGTTGGRLNEETALLRICDVHGVPLATNEASATALVAGLLD